MPPKTRLIRCEICGNRTSRMADEKRTFMAKFPIDESRCRQWVKAVGKEDLIYVPIEKLHTLKYVCGNHFEKKAFNKKKSRLKKFAVPSKNLRADPLSDEILFEFPCHIHSDIDFTTDNDSQSIHDNEDSLSQGEIIAGPSNSESYVPEQQLTTQGLNDMNIHQSRNKKGSPILESSASRYPQSLDHDYCITKENILQSPKRKKVSGPDFTPLSTAAIMNRRILITAANFLEPVMNRMKELRIWCLGRAGYFDTPYRYRVFRAMRVLPKSNNPEHQHGPRGIHCPRHDVAVIISLDQMYIWYRRPTHYQYAYPGYLTTTRHTLDPELLMAGSGFEYLEHIYENYKIFYLVLPRDDVVDCSKYLPKWWGKFICIKNSKGFPGIQNGGALITEYNTLVAVGCFEIRYNDDKIYVFTDLRYYVHWIHKAAELYPGQYYEYAYPQWGQALSMIYDGHMNWPYIPQYQKRDDLYPLGKK